MYKRYLIWFFSLTIAVGGFICAFIYFLDPLYLYHKLDDDNYYGATERYQMPGLVKNLDYDTLLVGTSMGRNFVESEVDEKLNVNSFNGSLPASTAREQRMVAELAIKNHELKNIIWELNYFSFTNEPDWVVEGASPFPTYMYDDNLINDVKYLLNPYARKMAVINWNANRNNSEDFRDPYKLYKFGEGVERFTIDGARSVIDNAAPKQIDETETFEVMKKSFDSNVIPFIERHPEIKFQFFYAPYCIVIPASTHKNDPRYTEDRINFKKYVYQSLSKYKNVEVYDFQDSKSVVYNVAHYMSDTIHYYRYINDWIIQELAAGRKIKSEDSYNKRLARYEKMITEFEISQLKSVPNTTP